MIVADRSRRRGLLWTPEHRATTVASLLVVSLIAFENMGVATAMPTTVIALHGQSLYSWPFTAFLVASVVATVLSGRICDRRGPGASLLAGPAIFLAGLVLCGLARNMPMLLTGRVLQGLGSGTVVVAVYLMIALVYADRERPAMFAANAAAWVAPAVIGPSVAGLITERFGWRWVFLGLIPLTVLALALLLPVARRLGGQPPGQGRRAGVLAATAVAAGVAVVTWAAQHPSPAAFGYGAAGLVVLVFALRGLLPPGTVTARPGLPAVVVSRALLGGSFAGMEAYLPLTMSAVHGYHPAMAGLPLTVNALGWSAASAVQGRHPDWSRETALRTGFCLVAVSLVIFAFVSQPWFPGWAAFVACAIGGAGMGTAYPSLSVLLLRFSPSSERGFNTSAMQLADWVASAVTVGVGGVLLGLLASAEHPSPAVAVLAMCLTGIALLGVFVTRRWPAHR